MAPPLFERRWGAVTPTPPHSVLFFNSRRAAVMLAIRFNSLDRFRLSKRPSSVRPWSSLTGALLSCSSATNKRCQYSSLSLEVIFRLVDRLLGLDVARISTHTLLVYTDFSQLFSGELNRTGNAAGTRGCFVLAEGPGEAVQSRLSSSSVVNHSHRVALCAWTAFSSTEHFRRSLISAKSARLSTPGLFRCGDFNV